MPRAVGLFTIPPPDRAVEKWHVSPAVDIAAYALSWIWVLIPLAILGPVKADYIVVYMIVLAATDVHRHAGLPYVYMDAEIRRQYPLRFFLLPVVLFAAWAASPWLAGQRFRLHTVDLAALLAGIVLLIQIMRRDGKAGAPSWRELLQVLGPTLGIAVVATLSSGDGHPAPAWWWVGAFVVGSVVLELRRRRTTTPDVRPRWTGPVLAVALALGALVFGAQLDGVLGKGVRPSVLLAAAAVVAGIWNIWHVLMQKYGILRLYSAKSGNDDKVPGWVDRLLIFGWIPFAVVYLGTTYRDVVETNFRRGERFLPPLLDAVEAISVVLLPLSILLVATAAALWIRAELRANRLRNAPRLWMAGGTMLLASCFLFMDPLEVYLSFAFSHAIEYFVFVWAFQRRRYHRPLAHAPALQRVLRHPWLAYGGFIFGLGIAFVLLKYYGRHINPMPRSEQPAVFGVRTSTWIMYWTTFQSMVHFYYDGFMWKMRSGAVRANI